MHISTTIENLPKIKEVSDVGIKLKQDIQNGNIACLSISYQENDIKEIEEFCEAIKAEFKKFIIIGTGGSSLGGKTFCSLAKNCPISFLESIDPDTVHEFLEEQDLTNTHFIFISKSGETTEVLANLDIIFSKLKKANIDLTKSCSVVTENKDNFLNRIAKDYNIKTLTHPSNIGGRFSYLSIVGLLPAYLAGLNIKNMRKAATKLIDNFVEKYLSDSVALNEMINNHSIKSHVIMPYVDKLQNFTEWYRQLWSESVGKNGFGIVPINSMGTRDQHSQLQLYIEGPQDKFFTFISARKFKHDFKLGILKNQERKTLSQILQIELDSTISVLKAQNSVIRKIEIDALNEESITQLMTYFVLETILISRINNINPFDQPAVEKRKEIAREMYKSLI